MAWTDQGVRCRADLLDLAAGLGQALQSVPCGARIAVRIADGLAFLAALLAIWRRDSAAVLLDPAGPAAADSEAFGAAACIEDAAGTGPQVRPLGGAWRPAGGTAVLKLTSGSTGRPRAVAVGAAALVADAEAIERAMGIGDSDRVLAAVPLSFSYGLGSVAIPALWAGRTIVLPAARDPLAILLAIRSGQPTVLPTVPVFLRALARGGPPLPPCVRLVLSAGARLEPELARAFRVAHGRAVHAFYGASECGGITYDRTGRGAERGSVGTPVDGVDLHLDGDGRVHVRSPSLAHAIEPDDGSIRDGEFATPDLGELRDGELVLLGRCSDVLDLGGYKVQPREIESLIQQLPGVEDVVVLPWVSAAGRAGCAALVAGRVEAAAVRRHCVQRLPAGKVPRCVVVVPALPRNGRGKIERVAAERLLHAAASPIDQVGA